MIRILAALACVSALAAARAEAARQYYFGADLSYINELEDCGARYFDGSRQRDPFELLHERGANLVRVRLWNDAKWTRYSNLEDVKKTIRRAHGAGMQVLLNYHYSDDWADGDKQIIPKAWEHIGDTDQLAQALYDFTYRTLQELDRAGLMPELVQVGNETNGEILSTLAKAKEPINWERNAKLFNAGIRAVRAASPGARVMLHIAQPENVEPWFATATAAGVTDYDLIGISYYRRWSSQTPEGLAGTIKNLRKRYGADVILVEAAYPWSLDNADRMRNSLGTNTLVDGYPATPEGQRRYLIDITQLVISSGGIGTVYWEPAWISTRCKTRWGTGSGWENAALFDFKGRILPGADYLNHSYQYPAESSSTAPIRLPQRTTGNFNEGWQFQRLPATTWADVTLPHTTRIEPRIVNDQWQGEALYRKRFAAPESWRGKRLFLRFEGAMNVAEVRLNGATLLRHLGGYLPFTVDLTPHLTLGRDNELTVALDNRDNPITGPKPMAILDFNMYGGLYRDVTLLVKDPLHITDEMLANEVGGGGVFVTYPAVSAGKAEIAVRTHIRNDGKSAAKFSVRNTLLDGDRVVARDTSAPLNLRSTSATHNASRLNIEKPQLWSPRSPKLYDLITAIEVDGKVVDERRTRIGIRRIEITRDAFRINGERMFLRGVNRHQEYPYVGYAISPGADYRDARHIKEAGFDFVRLSHYPQSPDFMAAADELGLVLLNSVPGWQYFNKDPAFSRQVLQTCRDMIRRDRNHPSVIAWECSLNETQMPKPLVQAFHRIVHEEYPGDQAFSAGWQNDGYDIYIQARQHRIEHYEPPDRPYLVSEYGDWEYYALNAGFNQQKWADLKPEDRSSRQLLSSGEVRLLQQATNLQEAHNDNFTVPAFADAYWVMFDYNRGYAEDLEASGVMSLERVPKLSYHFFRSQRDANESGPMVFIASYWTAESPLRVRVFGNVDEVELTLNGRRIGRQRGDTDRTSAHLRHPPFSFQIPAFQAGTLEAVGYIKGEIVARHRVTTPQAAERLEIELDEAGVCSAPGDLVFARARVVDKAGTVVPVSGRAVRFKAEAPLNIVGDAEVLTEAGVASALVQIRGVFAKAALSAASDAMSATRDIQSQCLPTSP